MIKKKIILNIIIFLIFILGIIGIAFWGPILSKAVDKSFRNNIDKNGTTINAIVSTKKYLKGHYVIYNYSYKYRFYKSKEQSNELYKSLEIGQTIKIKIDSTNPNDSYILITP